MARPGSGVLCGGQWRFVGSAENGTVGAQFLKSHVPSFSLYLPGCGRNTAGCPMASRTPRLGVVPTGATCDWV